MTPNNILGEQIAYYRARAQEYDESVLLTGRYSHEREESTENLDLHARTLLQQLPACETILELACGTGIWTRALLGLGQQVTALDASPEMLEINKQKLADPRVQYQQANLFVWEPDQTYDLVFFASWLSHVPPELLDSFLAKVFAAAGPGGKIAIFDQHAPTDGDLHAARSELYHERFLHDGRSFMIVKVFYDMQELRAKFEQAHFKVTISTLDSIFFLLVAEREIVTA